MAACGATKTAVIGFMQSLRHELEGTGLTLACVSRGRENPMAIHFFADPGKRGRELETAITPEQVVRATEKGPAPLPGTARTAVQERGHPAFRTEAHPGDAVGRLSGLRPSRPAAAAPACLRGDHADPSGPRSLPPRPGPPRDRAHGDDAGR
ncbi:hypothetical protein GCM10017771_60860 [Streptomyces capitiformicae]|uniref:Uncharacterized protein n=1 Tax=Streptomyces capitiformicae TaxID=2014920 RepID=A0A918Z8X0_9ACTN|nr:hypothetical protein GCM10017771_60860 [Streptomyces capitiformicae]